MPNKEPTKEWQWSDEFSRLTKTMDGQYRPKLRLLFSQAIQEAVDRERTEQAAADMRMTEEIISKYQAELIEKVRGLKKYHKEFECNGAFNGRGCYESWCEDQTCRNAPKEHNEAIEQVIALIKE